MRINDEYEAAASFVRWLESRVIASGRGTNEDQSDNEPSGRFWLGRLAPEEDVATTGKNEHGERLEPCAVGIRFRPAEEAPWRFETRVLAWCWVREGRAWRKVRAVDLRLMVEMEAGKPLLEKSFGREDIERSFERAVGEEGLSAEVRLEAETAIGGGSELVVSLVNTSSVRHEILKDTRLYECRLEVVGIVTQPFTLESLPDSFRYDRRVQAYGVNCGVETIPGGFGTTDTIAVDRLRPQYWTAEANPPDLSFRTLAHDPLGALRDLREALAQWGQQAWSEESLKARAVEDRWSKEMIVEAQQEAGRFSSELDRVSSGVKQLEGNEQLMKAFRLMNRAMAFSARGRGYDGWRPFQIGFILSNLLSISEPAAEADIVDIVWFATGGGKTETYLGLLVTAGLYDRMRGKTTGVTAWTRFPLRMLSLQQLQRFADALAGAEIVRRESGIEGAPFSLGYLVGRASTPNSINPDPKDEDEPHPDDEAMPARFLILQRCPFCRSEDLVMEFNRTKWALEHHCCADDCPWPERALPFYIVDDEVYRFLPTVVVGTLDKVASIGMQAAMRGLVGPPLGLCPRPDHGFTYSPRSNRPTGCLVPGCKAKPGALPMEGALFGPSFRLQDELHLLRDSLGAVDAHYEALLDGLELELCGFRPKILASSATLEGYEGQVTTLYRRDSRVFPQQGPTVSDGFWSADSKRLMRRYIAVAPRGLTIDYVIDRMLTELQSAVRELAAHPEKVCREIGVDLVHSDMLLSLYGTDVVYGNTLRDLDAVERSIQSGQIQVKGKLFRETLTGRTDFEQVRESLRRLEHPEPGFEDRIHVVTASAMMSHGVDVDRLNIMVMVGLPLGTAEFIQATARVGRRYPGLVFVVHEIGRERDAGVFRSFTKFVEQGDRFVEPIPITRRSRRVLARTTAGLELARILTIHEPRSGASLGSLKKLREYVVGGGMDFEREKEILLEYLGIDFKHDPDLVRDLEKWFLDFKRNILQPLPDHRFPGDASPTGQPMMSLRDVEDMVPLFLDRES